MMKMSYTRADQLLQCPRKFFHRYVLELPDLANAAGTVGLVIHGAMESALRTAQLQMPKEIPWGWLEVPHKSAWGATGVPPSPEDFAATTKMLRSWHTRVGSRFGEWLKGRAILGVEQKFELPHEDMLVTGYMDLVLGDQARQTVYVYDWKSGLRWASRDEVASDLQMDFYAWAVRKLHPWARKVVCVYEAMRHDYSVETVRTDERNEDFQEYLGVLRAQLERRMAAGQAAFEARPSSLCAYCAHAEGCPGLEDRPPGGIDERDPVEVARERKRIKALQSMHDREYERLSDALYNHIALTNKPVIADGTKYRIIANVRKEVPARAALGVLSSAYPESKPADWLDAFVVSDRRLEPMLDAEARAAVEKQLENLAERVVIGDKLQPSKA